MMKRIHFLAGLTLTVFIGLHLLNHLLSVFGADFHISFMNKLRLAYRNPLIEIILLLAVCTQIFTGVRLFSTKRETATHFFEHLQNWTGLYLALFLMIHISAVLVGRYFLHLDTNFYFGVAGLNTFPLNLFFIPYYGLAILSFFAHISAIHYLKMKSPILGLSIKKQSVLILMFGFIFTLVTFYGLTDKFKGATIPTEYQLLPEN